LREDTFIKSDLALYHIIHLNTPSKDIINKLKTDTERKKLLNLEVSTVFIKRDSEWSSVTQSQLPCPVMSVKMLLYPLTKHSLKLSVIWPNLVNTSLFNWFCLGKTMNIDLGFCCLSIRCKNLTYRYKDSFVRSLNKTTYEHKVRIPFNLLSELVKKIWCIMQISLDYLL